MRTRKLTVYPNPYAQLDASGRLAGAAPIGETPRLTSIMPNRAFVGAIRVLLDHDTRGRGPALAQQSRSEYRFEFGVDLVVVDSTGQLEAFYRQLARDADLFIVTDGKVPMAKLAAARAAAMASYRAEQAHEAECPMLSGVSKTCTCITDADTSEWSQQFAIDSEVAAFGVVAASPARRAAASPDTSKES